MQVRPLVTALMQCHGIALPIDVLGHFDPCSYSTSIKLASDLLPDALTVVLGARRRRTTLDLVARDRLSEEGFSLFTCAMATLAWSCGRVPFGGVGEPCGSLLGCQLRGAAGRDCSSGSIPSISAMLLAAAM